MNKIAIKISCGLGDSITYLSRLSELCRKENVDCVDVYITGGMPHVRNMIVDLYEISDHVNDIFLSNFNSCKYSKILNWVPENNPLEYDITIPYITPFEENNDEFANNFLHKINNPVIVNPYTLSGNNNSINEKYGRSGKEEFWCSLISELKNNKFTPIVIGGINDIINWKQYGCNPVVLYGDFYDFLDTIALIQNSMATVGTDSWPWEVSYYANKPTISINLINNYWFDFHIGKNTDNLLVYRKTPEIENIVNFLNEKLIEKKNENN